MYSDEYRAARTVLLDALAALEPHGDAIVVVGAQAVYLQTIRVSIPGIAPYTTDADLALDPARVLSTPLIETLMTDANFEQEGQPGIWWKSVSVNGRPTEIEVDLMVPDGALTLRTRRSAHVPPHERQAMRRARGLEGVTVDHEWIDITALDEADRRRFTVRVAGRAALVMAKAIKIDERVQAGKSDRLIDKDAADVYRLMLASSHDQFVERMSLILDDVVAGPVCRDSLSALGRLFGARRGVGVQMAQRALRESVPDDRVAQVCTLFVGQLRDARLL